MKEINDLLQQILCLVLAGDIGEFDTCLGLYINLGITLAELHGITHAAHPLRQRSGHGKTQKINDDQRKDPADQEAQHRIHLRIDRAFKIFNARIIQPVDKFVIIHHAGLVFLTAVVCKIDRIIAGIHFYLADLILIQHLQEIPVGGFLDFRFLHTGNQEQIQQDKNDHGDDIIKYQRLFVVLYFFHLFFSSLS